MGDVLRGRLEQTILPSNSSIPRPLGEGQQVLAYGRKGGQRARRPQPGECRITPL